MNRKPQRRLVVVSGIAHVTDADGNPITVTFDEDLNVVSIDQGH